MFVKACMAVLAEHGKKGGVSNTGAHMQPESALLSPPYLV